MVKKEETIAEREERWRKDKKRPPLRALLISKRVCCG
jgi:hypothetical protein